MLFEVSYFNWKQRYLIINSRNNLNDETWIKLGENEQQKWNKGNREREKKNEIKYNKK